MAEIGRPVPKRRWPVVMSTAEVSAVRQGLDGVHDQLARLLYGTGLRIEEALRLRVQALDCADRAVFARNGKGGKDRLVMRPSSLASALHPPLAEALRPRWAAAVAAGHAGVPWPDALERQVPRAGASRACFRVFTQRCLSANPCIEPVRRATFSCRAVFDKRGPRHGGSTMRQRQRA